MSAPQESRLTIDEVRRRARDRETMSAEQILGMHPGQPRDLIDDAYRLRVQEVLTKTTELGPEGSQQLLQLLGQALAGMRHPGISPPAALHSRPNGFATPHSPPLYAPPPSPPVPRYIPVDPPKPALPQVESVGPVFKPATKTSPLGLQIAVVAVSLAIGVTVLLAKRKYSPPPTSAAVAGVSSGQTPTPEQEATIETSAASAPPQSAGKKNVAAGKKVASKSQQPKIDEEAETLPGEDQLARVDIDNFEPVRPRIKAVPREVPAENGLGARPRPFAPQDNMLPDAERNLGQGFGGPPQAPRGAPIRITEGKFTLIDVLVDKQNPSVLLLNAPEAMLRPPSFDLDCSAAAIGDDEAFRVEPGENGLWQIVLGKKQGAADPAVETRAAARIVLRAGELHFEWAEPRPSEIARQVANCVLNVKLESGDHLFKLRQPVNLDDYRVDMSQSTLQTPFTLDAMPRRERLRLQTFTNAASDKMYELTPPDAHVAYGKLIRAAADTAELKHEFTFTLGQHKRGVALVQKVFCYPVERRIDYSIEGLEGVLQIATRELNEDIARYKFAQLRLQQIPGELSQALSMSARDAAAGQIATKLKTEEKSALGIIRSLSISIPKRQESFKKMESCLESARRMEGRQLFRHTISVLSDSGPILLAQTR